MTTENTQTASAATTTQPATDNEATSTKEQIYEMIGDFVKQRTEKRIGKAGGREIFDMVVNHVFAAAAKEGTFRFNGGFGALHVKTYSAGKRRLPSGSETTFGERRKLRYEEGVMVKELVSNGGDLSKLDRVQARAKASQERSSKAAEKSAKKEQKKTSKKTAPEKTVPPAAAVPAAPAKPAAAEEVNLT